MSLSIAYITARKEPRFDWFMNSLSEQLKEVDPGPFGMKLIVVDFYNSPERFVKMPASLLNFNFVITSPKPTVWQGPHRLTSVDYFAAANARNTALCLAPDGWIAFVDDLSILKPGWFSAVQEAMKRGRTITLGAYQKVFDLKVENGLAVGYRADLHGMDVRMARSNGVRRNCAGEWFYGCSLVAPVEAFLEINGWDENCDGMGYEDVVTGQLLQNTGWNFVYDPAMMTYEDQNLHQQSGFMKRTDKGESPNDKSHAILRSAKNRKWAPNYFGDGGISGLRQRVLNGEKFPIPKIPDRDWFDGQLLTEM